MLTKLGHVQDMVGEQPEDTPLVHKCPQTEGKEAS